MEVEEEGGDEVETETAFLESLWRGCVNSKALQSHSSLSFFAEIAYHAFANRVAANDSSISPEHTMMMMHPSYLEEHPSPSYQAPSMRTSEGPMEQNSIAVSLQSVDRVCSSQPQQKGVVSPHEDLHRQCLTKWRTFAIQTWAESLVKQGRNACCISVLQRHHSEVQKYPILQELMAKALIGARKDQEALEFLQSHQSSSLSLKLMLAEVYESQDLVKRAVAIYKHIFVASPQNCPQIWGKLFLYRVLMPEEELSLLRETFATASKRVWRQREHPSYQRSRREILIAMHLCVGMLCASRMMLPQQVLPELAQLPSAYGQSASSLDEGPPEATGEDDAILAEMRRLVVVHQAKPLETLIVQSSGKDVERSEEIMCGYHKPCKMPAAHVVAGSNSSHRQLNTAASKDASCATSFNHDSQSHLATEQQGPKSCDDYASASQTQSRLIYTATRSLSLWDVWNSIRSCYPIYCLPQDMKLSWLSLSIATLKAFYAEDFAMAYAISKLLVEEAATLQLPVLPVHITCLFNLGLAEELHILASKLKQQNASIAHYAYGCLYLLRGNFGEAIQLFKDSTDGCREVLGSVFGSAQLAMGQTLASCGYTDQAIRALQQALAYEQGNPTLLYFLGRTYAKRGSHRLAKASLQKAMKLQPISPSLLNEYGTLVVEEESFAEAAYYLLLATRVANGGLSQPRLSLELQTAAGCSPADFFNRVLRSTTSAMWMRPRCSHDHRVTWQRDESIYCNFGHVLIQLALRQGADAEDNLLNYAEKAEALSCGDVQIQPNDKAAGSEGEAESEHSKRLLDIAIGTLKEAEAINPNDPNTRQNLGVLFFLYGDYERALLYLTKAAYQNATAFDLSLTHNLISLAFDRGAYSSATEFPGAIRSCATPPTLPVAQESSSADPMRLSNDGIVRVPPLRSSSDEVAFHDSTDVSGPRHEGEELHGLQDTAMFPEEAVDVAESVQAMSGFLDGIAGERGCHALVPTANRVQQDSRAGASTICWSSTQVLGTRQGNADAQQAGLCSDASDPCSTGGANADRRTRGASRNRAEDRSGNQERRSIQRGGSRRRTGGSSSSSSSARGDTRKRFSRLTD